MSTTSRAPRDLNAEITERICAALEQGVKPWVKPWNSGVGEHRNAISGRAYNGCNVLLLNIVAGSARYQDPRWLTYRQAQAVGGQVRRGEKGAQVIFWRVLPKEQGDKPTRDRLVLRAYTVFNVAQCDGLDLDAVAQAPEPTPAEVTERVAKVLDAITADGCTVIRGFKSAFYTAGNDAIGMPAPAAFRSLADFDATFLHEVAHATGHAKRLGRDLGHRFGSGAYAMEELIAEMGSAFLCAHLGVTGDLQHENYVGHWLQVLAGDRYAIFTAAREAERACRWVLDRAGLAVVDATDDDEAEAA